MSKRPLIANARMTQHEIHVAILNRNSGAVVFRSTR